MGVLFCFVLFGMTERKTCCSLVAGAINARLSWIIFMCDVLQRFTYSLVTKVTCSTAQQTDDSRKKGCSASSCEIFLPFLKECRIQPKCEWGPCTFHHKEIVWWAWGSSLFYSFNVNKPQASTQYHFRLEKRKKKPTKKPQPTNQKKKNITQTKKVQKLHRC